MPEAGKKAHAAMHAVLDAFVDASPYDFAAKRSAVMTVEGRTIVAHMKEARPTRHPFRQWPTWRSSPMPIGQRHGC